MEGFDWSTLAEQGQALLAQFGLKVLGAFALLIVGWMIGGAIKRALRRLFARTEFDETLEVFLTSLVYWLFMIIVVVAVLGVFGVETTSLVAVLGAGGFAVGLAMQGTLSNFSAGVMLLIFRPFKLGDFIEAAGVSGTVDSIGIFSTGMNTPDNVHIIVPNSEVYGTVVMNYNVNPTRRNDIVMGVGYDDDIPTAIGVIRRVVEADARVLPEPEPVIAVGELADSSVNILVRPWCKREDYWALRWDLLANMKVELEAAGCSIPYPQTDVHLHGTQPPAPTSAIG